MRQSLFIVLIMLLTLGLFACQKKSSSESSNAAISSQPEKQTTGGSDLPEKPTSGGLLILDFHEDQMPDTLSGYVVGHQEDLTVQKTSDGQYYINNIPPGPQDVILTGKLAISSPTSLISMNALVGNEADRGVRLNKVRIVKGERVSEFVSDFPKLGQLKGIAKLSGSSDHSGIVVYIPGTPYEARTDNSGSFSIPDVVQGLHNLYFEKDGYHRGRIEQLSVRGETDNITPSVELVLSTGATGKIATSSDQTTFTTLDVPLNIVANDSAVLMRLSEDPNFISSVWQPLQSTLIYRFSAQGLRNLYVEFADANGLVSGPFEIEISISLFPDLSGGIKLSNDSTTSLSELVDLSITIPPNADQMMLATNSLFDGAVWEPVADKKAFNLGYAPSDRQVFVKFRTKDLLESQSWSASIAIPRNNWSKIIGHSSSSFDFVKATVALTDSVLIVGSLTGPFQGTAPIGGSDVFLLKIDWDGNVLWSKLIGGTADDYPWAATTGADGSIYVVGETAGTFMGQVPQSSRDAFVSKLTSQGDHVWTRLLSTSGQITRATTVAVTNDAVIVGWTNTAAPAGSRLTRFDFDGNQLNSISCGTNNGPLVLGVSADKSMMFAAWLSTGKINLKSLSASGDSLWQKSLSVSAAELSSIVITGSNEVILGEKGNFTIGGPSGSVVSKWASNGDLIYRRFLAPYSPSQNGVSSLAIGFEGDIYALGTTYGSLTDEIVQNTDAETFVARLDKDGSVRYIRLLGSTNAIYSGGIVFHPNKGILVTGTIIDEIYENVANPGPSSLLVKTMGH